MQHDLLLFCYARVTPPSVFRTGGSEGSKIDAPMLKRPDLEANLTALTLASMSGNS
jgi:hypothetical protein